jgi:hypothetical protein
MRNLPHTLELSDKYQLGAVDLDAIVFRGNLDFCPTRRRGSGAREFEPLEEGHEKGFGFPLESCYEER